MTGIKDSAYSLSRTNNKNYLTELITKLSNTLIKPVSSESLEDLGKRLELNQTERLENNQYVFRLTDAIQRKFAVSRFYVSGSYGRRVAVGVPEIELVVFLKSSEDPPYDKSPNDHFHKLHKFLVELARDDPTMSIKKKSSDNAKTSQPFHILVMINNTMIRVFLAPALGRTSEDQRQIAYRRMQTLYLEKGLEALMPWHACLIEKPSELMAQCNSKVQSLIRVCQFWVQLNEIKSLDKYAVETLALIIGIKMLDKDSLDLVASFNKFLEYCQDLSEVNKICEIQSPASYTSPWSRSSGRILTDNFNPYNNLLASLTTRDAQKLASMARGTRFKLSQSSKNNIILKDIFVQQEKKVSIKTFLSIMAIIILLLAIMLDFHYNGKSIIQERIRTDGKNLFDSFSTTTFTQAEKFYNFLLNIKKYIN